MVEAKIAYANKNWTLCTCQWSCPQTSDVNMLVGSAWGCYARCGCGRREEKSKQITRCSFHFNCVRIDFDRNLMFTKGTPPIRLQINFNQMRITFQFHCAAWLFPSSFIFLYFPLDCSAGLFLLLLFYSHSRVVNSFNIETGILLDTLCVWHK